MLHLEQDFAHFGYPHTIVSDNATTFTSEEFQEFCNERGIYHLTGAPYHPATNGSAERLVQSFKQSLKKSFLPPKEAVQEFLLQYRRTPLPTGYSPSELLNGRQIRPSSMLSFHLQLTLSKLSNGRSTVGSTKERLSLTKFSSIKLEHPAMHCTVDRAVTESQDGFLLLSKQSTDQGVST